jgi:hypothetical protein
MQPPKPPPFIDSESETASAAIPPEKGAADKIDSRTASSAGSALDGRNASIIKDAASPDYLEMLALGLQGDDLADDIFAEGAELLAGALDFRHGGRSAETAFPESSVLSETAGPREANAEPENGGSPSVAAAPIGESVAAESASGAAMPVDPVLPEPDAAASQAESAPAAEAAGERMVEDAGLSVLFPDDGPVASIPLATEQPKLSVASERTLPETEIPPASSGVKVLMLPYHDRDNPNNLIPHTGGGEVVTSIFGASLAARPEVRLLWDATGQATHSRLVDVNEAIGMGRIAGADYVVRGQVVEFRRAQSVPSLYSAVISTAVLAAQIVFAEMSGVDVATEVYRVSDSRCVMSRRDRAQQKYVVQAEKTVRRLAVGAVESLVEVMTATDPEAMDPLIDTLSPVTVLTNPR